MEQLQNHFYRITRQNPNLSSLICFNLTMKTRQYKDIDIENAFTKLVDKSDYNRGIRETLISWARDLNNRK